MLLQVCTSALLPLFFPMFFLWDLMLHQISVSKHVFAHVSLTFITHLYNLPSFFYSSYYYFVFKEEQGLNFE